MESPAACNNQTQFGDLTWVINGKDYTFTADEWIYPPVFGKAAAQISSKELTEIKSSNRNSYEQDDVSYIIQDSPAFAQSYLDQISNSLVQLLSTNTQEPSSNDKDEMPNDKVSLGQ